MLAIIFCNINEVNVTRMDGRKASPSTIPPQMDWGGIKTPVEDQTTEANDLRMFLAMDFMLPIIITIIVVIIININIIWSHKRSINCWGSEDSRERAPIHIKGTCLFASIKAKHRRTHKDAPRIKSLAWHNNNLWFVPQLVGLCLARTSTLAFIHNNNLHWNHPSGIFSLNISSQML